MISTATRTPVTHLLFKSKLALTNYKFRKERVWKLWADVFHRTSNLHISRSCFIEDGNEMYQQTDLSVETHLQHCVI